MAQRKTRKEDTSIALVKTGFFGATPSRMDFIIALMMGFAIYEKSLDIPMKIVTAGVVIFIQFLMYRLLDAYRVHRLRIENQ